MKMTHEKLIFLKNQIKHEYFRPRIRNRSHNDYLKIYFIVFVLFALVKYTVAEKGHLSAQGLNSKF